MVILVRDEMNKNVRTLGPNDTVSKAADMMSKYWMGSIVIAKEEEVLGIITERDILSKLVVKGKDPSKIKIKELMSSEVKTISEEDTLEAAIKAMKAYDIKKLPVMKNGKLTGIITTTDIITAMEDEFKDGKLDLGAFKDLKVLVRRHSIDIADETKKNQILTFIISNSLYPMDSISIVKDVKSVIPNILYVTVNKPYFSILKTFENKGIKTDSFYFIDASSGGDAISKGKNYEKIAGTSNMTEILLAVEKCIHEKKYGGVIFDSISTLLAYQEEDVVIRFTHSLINKLRESNVKGLFMCIKEDLKTNLMKNLNMLADYSVDIDKGRTLSDEKESAASEQN